MEGGKQSRQCLSCQSPLSQRRACSPTTRQLPLFLLPPHTQPLPLFLAISLLSQLRVRAHPVPARSPGTCPLPLFLLLLLPPTQPLPLFLTLLPAGHELPGRAQAEPQAAAAAELSVMRWVFELKSCKEYGVCN